MPTHIKAITIYSFQTKCKVTNQRCIIAAKSKAYYILFLTTSAYVQKKMYRFFSFKRFQVGLNTAQHFTFLFLV